MKKLLVILLILEVAFILSSHWPNYYQPSISPQFPETTAAQAPSPTKIFSRFIDNNVTFTPQAPFAEWNDPRFQDACEEVSSLMAVKWARGESISSPEAVKAEIIYIADYQLKNFGGFTDTSARDTIERIIKGYFKYFHAEALSSVTLDDIKQQLFQNHIVLVPADGTKLDNPFFTSGGPDRHMVLIRGFDPATNEFITNDAGTRHGEAYRYDQNLLFSAIRDYPTGNHLPILGEPKNIIVVSKP